MKISHLKKLYFVLLMLCTSFSAYAYDFEENGIYYNILSTTDKTCAVTYRDYDYDSYSGTIVIPSSVTYNSTEYKVTQIRNKALYGCRLLTSINIPKSVTYIGEYTFYGCSSLKSINIPKSVTSIEEGTFLDCRSLTSINIPESVTSIKGAFVNCSSLTSINIPKSVTYIGDYAFSNCSSLTSINIPESVTYIGRNTFSGCRSLTSVNIPESVTYIGNEAFYHCWSLTSINIPESVTYIGDYTFYNCSKLKSINIPKSVTGIGYYAFYLCLNLTAVYYTGTKSEWNAITISSGNEALTNSEIIFVTDRNDIESISDGNSQVTYYDMNGVKLSKPRKCINIIKTSNGVIKKVNIK